MVDALYERGTCPCAQMGTQLSLQGRPDFFEGDHAVTGLAAEVSRINLLKHVLIAELDPPKIDSRNLKKAAELPVAKLWVRSGVTTMPH